MKKPKQTTPSQKRFIADIIQNNEKKVDYKLSAIMGFTALFMLIINILSNYYYMALLSFSYLIIALVSLVYFKKARDYSVWIHLFLVFSFIAVSYLFYTGGTKGAGILWAFAFPLLAFQFKKLRVALVYSFTLFFVLLIFFAFNLHSSHSNDHTQSVIFMMVYFLILLSIILFQFVSSQQKIQNDKILQESKDRFYSLFNQLTMGVALIDTDMQLLEANQQLRKWFPQSLDHSKSKCFESMSSENNNTYCAECQAVLAMNDGLAHTIETEKILGGKKCVVRITAHPVFDNEGKITSVIETIEDVSDFALTKQALQTANKFYNQALDMFCIIGFDGRFKALNPAWEKDLKWISETLIGQPFETIVYTDDQKLTTDFITQISTSDTASTFEFRVVSTNGTIRWVSMKCLPDQNDNSIFAVARDITERKKNTAQIIENEQKLSNLIANLPGFVLHSKFDGNWSIFFISEGCLELTGYSHLDFVNGNVSYDGIIHPDDQKNVIEQYQSCTSDDDAYGVEYRIIHANGNIRWMWEKGRVKYNQKENERFLDSFITDITENKRIHEALKESEARFKTIFNNHHSTMLLIEPETAAIVDANPAAVQFYGYSKKELCSMKITDINHVSKEAYSEITSSIFNNIHKRFTFDHYISDGTLKHVEAFTSLVKFNQQNFIFSIVNDITESKKAEIALRESEEKFRTLMDSAAAGIYMYRDNRFIIVNSAVEAISGYSKEMILNKSIQEVVHPNSLDKVLTISQARFKGEKPINRYEIQIIKADGTAIWIDHSAELVMVDGQPTAIGTFFDITQQKSITEALKISEERMRFINNNLYDVIWAYNTKAKSFSFISPSVLQLRGYTAEESMSQTLDESLTPESAKMMVEIIVESVNNFIVDHDRDKSHRISTIQQPCKDGSIVNVEVSTHIQYNQNDELEIIGVSRNVNDRMKMEESLNLNAAFQKTIADISKNLINFDRTENDEVLFHALEQCGNFLNADRCTIFQLSDDLHALTTTHEWCRENIESFQQSAKTIPLDNMLSLKKLIQTKSHFYVEDVQNIYENAIYEREMFFQRKTKTLLVIPLMKIDNVFGYFCFESVTKKVAINDALLGYVQVLANIFADAIMKIKLDGLLRQNAIQLAESNDTKNRLFSIIAHDLRSPFTSFIGLSELMSEEGIIDSMEEMRKHALQLHALALSTYDLLDNLLQWSRLQSGDLRPNIRNHNVSQFIELAISSLLPLFEQKFLKFNNLTNMELEGRFDANMIEIAIRNLLSNAMKFTHPGGKIIISGRKDHQNQLIFTVSDTGIGIPKQTLAHLFTFNNTKGRIGLHGERSSGLGLMLCKEFVEKHNGTISAVSTEDKGSTFTIVLPQHQ